MALIRPPQHQDGMTQESEIPFVADTSLPHPEDSLRVSRIRAAMACALFLSRTGAFSAGGKERGAVDGVLGIEDLGVYGSGVSGNR